MIHLEDYLVATQINDIEEIIFNDQIDEGKIKNGIKKIWDFITGKKKKKKVKPAGSSVSSSSLNDSDNDSKKTKKISIEKITWNEIRDTIKIDDKLKRAKERSKNSKVEMNAIKDGETIAGLMVYMNHSEIKGYEECPYILALQIDPDYQGKGYLKKFVEKIYDLCKSNGQRYILVSNSEYSSKDYWKNSNFDGTIEDPKDKDKSKAHYGEPGKIVNSVKE